MPRLGTQGIMKYRVWVGAAVRRCAALALPLLVLLPAGPQPVSADPGVLPTQVSALYKIRFGLLGEIGTFQFKSIIEGESYALTADAKIDTTVFDYLGNMASHGAVHTPLATPADYQFRYKQKAMLGKKKAKALEIAFDETGARNVTFDPPDPPSKKVIPVTQEQLRSTLDPLSGVMALSLGSMDNPCDRTLPIFDGKQRFDLIFTPTGRTEGSAHDVICNVRLVPISGHKPGEGSDSVISGNIEVALRPIPKAHILIPSRVTVPTIIGSAVLTSDDVEITMPDRQRIALRR